MAVGEWDQRQLCPDGSCIGVIGPEGICKVCGRAAPNWGEERKRGLTNKKVSNRKLKMELGYQFKYPTFRQGYTAEITRLERAGLLDIGLEPR